ncbi:hypothetical protein [Pseudooctadecabacter jejudonensis]|uniref:Uncharacterized protein n=1 Tax=Pseudooctadecabacter jejudonensis TaxID=1391910 RepID=A0A1Y5RDA9_9RHOB|nr:hypothetical protein [Pseudooctadecabacter jejudonensis]SLN12271.1 hypothetical protein PSJ8397_00159 [Pseudooctadecabacter jejudonensis]
MLGWLTLGGLMLVAGLLADDWLANRYRRPLSHMRPKPADLKKLGMEETDLSGLRRLIDRNSR